MKFSFIHSHNSAAPAYGVYFSRLKRYNRFTANKKVTETRIPCGYDKGYVSFDVVSIPSRIVNVGNTRAARSGAGTYPSRAPGFWLRSEWWLLNLYFPM
jgi:hypothetical protein